MGDFVFDVGDMIGGPFVRCPACGKDTMGVIGVGPAYLNRRCKTCLMNDGVPLPELTKKVIYLDQFAISDMMKVLDPEAPSHAKTLPRWLELFEQLDRLSKLQLIVCPDSWAHRDESLLHPATKKLKRLYELFSHGASFSPFHLIRNRQVYDYFLAWLDGHEPPGPGERDRMVDGDLHGWTDRLSLSVDLNLDDSADIRRRRAEAHEALLALYARWAAERPSYEEVLAKELRAFGEIQVQVYMEWMRRMAAIDAGGPLPDDVSELLPPPVARFIHTLMCALEERGFKPGERLPKVVSFLTTADFGKVPAANLAAHLWASVAREAPSAKPPESGRMTDFDVISCLLPYCDAMLLDRACVGLLRRNPLAEIVEGYGCKVFSPRDHEEFMVLLKGIEEEAPPEHLGLVGDVYGPDWPTPFTTLFTYECDDPD